MATSSETPDDISEHLKNFHIKEYSKPQTFHPFTNLPTEIRLKIYNLVATQPRIIHFDHAGATRSKLALDPQIPPLLHLNRESRTETIHLYSTVSLNRRKLYINPTLDILLWISYPGPRTFKKDLEILVEIGDFPDFYNLAISQKFWNRIISDTGPYPFHGTGNQDILYHMIRKDAAEGNLGKVTVLDTDLRWDGVKGCAVKLVRRRMSLRVKGGRGKRAVGREEAWGAWDGVVGGRREEYERDFEGCDVAEVERGRVVFVRR